MGGQVATPPSPFGTRVRASLAIFAIRVLQYLPASLAFLNYRLAGSAIERASFSSHEDALHALLDRNAFHSSYLLKF